MLASCIFLGAMQLRTTTLPIVIGPHYTDGLAGLAFYRTPEDSVLMSVGWKEGDKFYSGYKDLVDHGLHFREAAPDGSYNRIFWFRDASNRSSGMITFEWAQVGQGAVAKISSDSPTSIQVGFSKAWPGSKPFIGRDGDGLLATSTGFVLAISHSPSGIEFRTDGAAMLDFSVTPDRPAMISIDPQAPLTWGRVSDSLKARAAQYERMRAQAAGDRGDFVSPIADELGHSRVYSPETKRLTHIVSRGWCLPDGQVLFCWDSFFNGLLSSIENPAAGKDTVRAILAAQQPNGLVPNFFGRGWGVSADRSQPPVGSLCVWKMHVRSPDKRFLAEVYPKLKEWHAWWFSARDGNRNGLLEWGSETKDTQNARFESGLDDSPMFDEATMSGPNMTMDATDLNGLYAMDADYLSRIAQALGKTEEAHAYRKECDSMCRRMNDLLWSADTGNYLYRHWNPVHPKVLVPASSFSASGSIGFQGEYFEGDNFARKVADRLDPAIDFLFDGAPIAGLKKTHFSIRWNSTFTAPKTAQYTFETAGDDGVRLWIDEKLVVDDWKVQTSTKTAVQIDCQSGSQHSIKMEYFQAEGGANVSLKAYTMDDSGPGETFLQRQSTLNFYPMMAGAPSRGQADRMLAILFDSKKFRGEFMCPTIEMDDPAYPHQGYWRGTIWGPTNYLLYQGLRRYASDSQRAEYAEKSVKLFMKNWNADGSCHENFNAMTGVGRSDPHYTWGSLLCLIGIEDLCDIEPDGMLRLNGVSGIRAEIKHFLLGGKQFNLLVRPDSAELRSGGKMVLRAEKTAVRVKPDSVGIRL